MFKIFKKDWYTYERKRVIFILGLIVAAVSFAVGVIGMIFFVDYHMVTHSDGTKTTEIKPNGIFFYMCVSGLGVFMILMEWFHAISKRRNVAATSMHGSDT